MKIFLKYHASHVTRHGQPRNCAPKDSTQNAQSQSYLPANSASALPWPPMRTPYRAVSLYLLSNFYQFSPSSPRFKLAAANICGERWVCCLFLLPTLIFRMLPPVLETALERLGCLFLYMLVVTGSCWQQDNIIGGSRIASSEVAG